MDSDSRFSELLNPVRDLDKNWQIEISHILQEYLQELTHVSLSINNGESTINFAQAALLIQGSTCVYSKKVEYLYSLAFQLLQRLNNEKKSVSSSTAGKERDLISFVKNDNEFVALDDIKKAKNLRLSDDILHKRHCRPSFTPLSLVPLEDSEKGDIILLSTKKEVIGNKRDFQLNTCNVHPSGVLLLTTTDEKFLPKDIYEKCSTPFPLSNGTLNFAEDFTIDNVSDIPVASPQSLSAAEDLLEDVCDESESPIEPGESDLLPRRRSIRQAEKAQKAIEEKEKNTLKVMESAWKLKEQELPDFKKKIQKKNVRKLAEKLLKKCPAKTRQQKEDAIASSLNFCGKAFFSHETKSEKKVKSGNNVKVFELLYLDGLQKHKALLQNCRKKLKLNENIVEVREDPDSEGDNDLGADVLSDDGDDGAVSPVDNDEPAQMEDKSTNEELNTESPYENIPVVSTYEDLVRKHIESYMKDVAQYCQTTELSEKVNKWEERINPILESESNREKYNIHVYGDRILENFSNNNRKQSLTFNEICKGKKKWEICRYFLASLQLANTGNIEISNVRCKSGSDKIDISLLSRKRHHEDLATFGHSGGEH